MNEHDPIGGSMKIRLTTLLLALLVGGFVAAGCGDDDEDSGGGDTAAESPPADTTTTEETTTESSGSGGGGAKTLKVDADPSGALKFTKDTLSAKAGQVTIEMGNPSDLPHAVGIEGDGVDEAGETVQKGGTSTASADLKPGEYEFYCPVPGHREGGMTGTLTVK
jgi:plastocyanin